MTSNKIRVSVKTLPHFKGELPKYETPQASGLDVRAQLTSEVVIEVGARVVVSTGLVVEIPYGMEIQVRPRSGWAIREGLTLINSPGTIDADYRGEIKIGLINLGNQTIVIKDQDRIAQLVLTPVYQLEWHGTVELGRTERDTGGFGSTGF